MHISRIRIYYYGHATNQGGSRGCCICIKGYELNDSWIIHNMILRNELAHNNRLCYESQNCFRFYKKYFVYYSLFMKKIISLALVLAFLLPITAEARSYRTKSSDVYVKSYTTKSGKYVPAYYRSKSDGKKSNNYSCTDHGRCY